VGDGMSDHEVFALTREVNKLRADLDVALDLIVKCEVKLSECARIMARYVSHCKSLEVQLSSADVVNMKLLDGRIQYVYDSALGSICRFCGGNGCERYRTCLGESGDPREDDDTTYIDMLFIRVAALEQAMKVAK